MDLLFNSDEESAARSRAFVLVLTGSHVTCTLDCTRGVIRVNQKFLKMIDPKVQFITFHFDEYTACLYDLHVSP